MKLIYLFLAFIFMSGCVSLDSVSVTPVPANRSQKVRAEAERFIVLGFNFDNDYVNGLTNDLKAQCSNGTVTGLLAKTETIQYFSFIFWKKRVSATGYCVPSKLAAKTSDLRKRKPSDEAEASNETNSQVDTLDAEL